MKRYEINARAGDLDFEAIAAVLQKNATKVQYDYMGGVADGTHATGVRLNLPAGYVEIADDISAADRDTLTDLLQATEVIENA